MGSGTITTETACHYDDHGNLKVTDVMVIFCKASVKGLSDTISARVYSSGADSFPDVELASGKINVADLTSAALNGDPVFIPVSDYSAQPGAFLVSIDYSAIDDTISVMINNVLSLNGGPDGKKEKRVKQMENSVWKSAYDIWNLGGRQFDADALIIPVVSIETENGIYKTPEFELSSPFPNPANNVLYIQYVCLEKNPLEITIYDQIGRQKKSGILPYSLNGSVEIKTDEWSAGKYYYLIRGMKFQTVGKFEIVE